MLPRELRCEDERCNEEDTQHRQAVVIDLNNGGPGNVWLFSRSTMMEQAPSTPASVGVIFAPNNISLYSDCRSSIS